MKYTPLAVMLVGFAIAYRNYIAKPGAPAAFVALPQVAAYPGLADFVREESLAAARADVAKAKAG